MIYLDYYRQKSIKILFLLLMLFLSVIAKAQTQTLVLWHADGSTTDVDLSTEPKVTFTGSKLLIKSTVLDMEYATEEIVRFTYKTTGTDIDLLKDDADYQQHKDCIIFHNISATDRVTIYRPDGIRIPVRLIVNGTDTVLPLSSLPQGTYIISVNGRTSKFMRK